jgi:predicted TIM-barrel fold metal-dependent hydrolase
MSSAPTPAGIVDWHAHWVPPEVVALLAGRSAEPCIVCADGVRVFHPGGGVRQPLKEGQLDLAQRRAEMERAGISRQVLSLAVVLGTFLDRLPGELELALVSANNQGLARLVAAEGDRFAGLAAIPLAHLEAAPSILEKAIVDQGLLGAILPADGFADQATAQRFAPLFEVAERHRAHLFIHPGGLPGTAPAPVAADAAAMVRRRAVGFQDSLTAAAVTFTFTDFLDPYPNVVVHLANLGGNIALLAERIAFTAERMALAPVPDHRRRWLVDTASFGPRGITLAADVLGAERLLFGTDSPALAVAPGVAGLQAAALSAEQKNRILAGGWAGRPLMSGAGPAAGRERSRERSDRARRRLPGGQ